MSAPGSWVRSAASPTSLPSTRFAAARRKAGTNAAPWPAAATPKLRLARADLSGAVLRGSDFSFADLSGVDFMHADLRDANFTGANLSGADLRWADLRGATLRWADLTGTEIDGAHLDGVDASSACIEPYHEERTTSFSGAVVGGYLSDHQQEILRGNFEALLARG